MNQAKINFLVVNAIAVVKYKSLENIVTNQSLQYITAQQCKQTVSSFYDK